LSDFGDLRAVPLAVQALTDSSKLVRWRAARIIGELGNTESVAAALKQTERSENAFEVAFEMSDAARRVRQRVSGSAAGTAGAAGPIWKQIQNGIAQNEVQ